MNRICSHFFVFASSTFLVFSTIDTSILAATPSKKSSKSKRKAKSKSAPDRELKDILVKMDKLWVGDASEAELKMDVKTKNYTRTLELKYWVKGKKNTLVLINAPVKEKGTATLKIGEDMYNYLPKIARTIKVSAALRGGSWMGSHFTNDDLVRATLLGEHYTSKVLEKKTDKKSKKENWTIELLPKKDAVTTWGKVILDINKTDLLPLKQQYFDEDKKLVRTITYSNVKKISDRIIPTVVKVVPEMPKDEYTEITYNKVDYTVDIDDSFFSLTNLKNLK